MVYERLRNAKKKIVGTKRALKAVQKGEAKVVFVARDAEARVTEPLLRICREKGVEVVMVDSMTELGQACAIEVGSASAAVIEE
ncbi:MAG: 50S ribosomal protein L7Ae-like protein [Clostridia bacterium]|nr:MAG: 50S ribosomal protein L7Ae-like protein [Clostridia bacterium]